MLQTIYGRSLQTQVNVGLLRFDVISHLDIKLLVVCALATWSQVSASGSIPIAREGHRAELDPSTSAMYMFGGDNAKNNPTAYSDIWLFDISTGCYRFSCYQSSLK